MKDDELDHSDNQKLNNINQHLKKDFEDKKRIDLELFNLLVHLINEQVLLRNQLFKNSKADASEVEAFKKSINHVLALLGAAQEGLKQDGPSHFTDYLITSALSYLADYLPADAVTSIANRLDEFKKNNEDAKTTNAKNSASDKPANTNERSANNDSSVTSPKQKSHADKCFNDLVSCVSPILLTSERNDFSSPANHNRNIIIDFAADKLLYREYGIRRAKRLGANLIQVQPNQFSAAKANFSISRDTTLTLIGHCTRGSAILSDNRGNAIFADEIARQIYSKMTQTKTDLTTEFTIDLIACQAASPHHKHPSFAERLAKELAKLGIINAKVIASPTIMLTTYDGSQANLSREQDRKASNQHTNGFVENLFSSFNSIFPTKCEEVKLNVEKVTFNSSSYGNAVKVK